MSSPFRRRLRMGLQTLLGPAVGLRRQGFFIPYRYADTVAAAQPVYAALEQCFDAAAEAMRAVLAAADGFAGDLARIAEAKAPPPAPRFRSEEHTSELQSLMRISYAVFCLKKKTHN